MTAAAIALQCDKAPRWLRELGRFMQVKNLLLLYGNIHDQLAYPIEGKKAGGVNWTSSVLRGFLQRLLDDKRYEIVGMLDPVEPLTFTRTEMRPLFEAAACRAVEAQAGSTQEELPEWDRTVEQIGRCLANSDRRSAFVIHFASRLVSSPNSLLDGERLRFTRLLKASLQAVEDNLLILVCDKVNDLPPFLYLTNPKAKCIQIDLPDREDRQRFIETRFAQFYQARGTPSKKAINEFAELTDGMTRHELNALQVLSSKCMIGVGEGDDVSLKSVVEMFKFGVSQSRWDQIDEQLAGAADAIHKQINGQAHAVNQVLDILKRGRLGLAAGQDCKPTRPRGVLFFAGPTGVGKTELAKALARALFGESWRDKLVRFDMSEYGAEHSEARLLGAPPGYTGYDEGGQLTGAVKKNPFCVLLFDEIEKAHPLILDKFLQLLDDGRLTDGRGETAYFSECVIIFTSNLGTVASPLDKFTGGKDAESAGTPRLVTSEMKYSEMRDVVLRRIRNAFTYGLGRPELFNRFGDSFVVFDFIREGQDEKILKQMLTGVVKQAKELGFDLHIEAKAVQTLLTVARQRLEGGGRGIRNAVDTVLVNPLSRAVCDQRIKPPFTLRVSDILDHGDGAAHRYEVVIQNAATCAREGEDGNPRTSVKPSPASPGTSRARVRSS